MFENGNYRRRRRMKRPYRTGAHYSKMFPEGYATNTTNFGPRTVFTPNHYQAYPRYDPSTPWMPSTQLGSYPPCPSRQSFSYTAAPVSKSLLINYKTIFNDCITFEKIIFLLFLLTDFLVPSIVENAHKYNLARLIIFNRANNHRQSHFQRSIDSISIHPSINHRMCT